MSIAFPLVSVSSPMESNFTRPKKELPRYFICTSNLVNGEVQLQYAMAKAKACGEFLKLNYYVQNTPFQEMWSFVQIPGYQQLPKKAEDFPDPTQTYCSYGRTPDAKTKKVGDAIINIFYQNQNPNYLPSFSKVIQHQCMLACPLLESQNVHLTILGVDSQIKSLKYERSPRCRVSDEHSPGFRVSEKEGSPKKKSRLE